MGDQHNVSIVIEKRREVSTPHIGDKRKITVSGKSEKDVNEAIEEIYLEKT